MNKNLSLALKDSINTEVGSIATNIAEVGLDSIIEDDMLKEIPILSTAVSLYKLGSSIRERHYLSKLSGFVSELNKGICDKDKQEYYKKRITEDITIRNKELEYILLLIDRYIQTEKAGMLAKLYLCYLDMNITWVDLTKYAEVIDRFLPGDYNMLQSASIYRTEHDEETDSIQRLIALGLVIEGFRTMATQEENGTVSIDPPELREKKERNYSRTEFGNILVKILGEMQ